MPAPKLLPSRAAGPGIAGSAAEVLQSKPGRQINIQPKAAFSGIGANGYLPPDPNIAVGQQYIVQMVNSELAVFDKSTGSMVMGPVSLGSMWSGLSGCGSSNAGDPIVQYDSAAGRWLISQLGSTSGPYSECIAVSKTSDPRGAYYLYADTQFGNNLNDYPKFGVWPTKSNSAYLATYNLFQSGNTFIGSELCAYDREAMLSGTGAPTPAVICKTIQNDGGFLPSDLDGATAPADGTPGYFLNFETTSSLRLYELAPDFTTPSNSTLTQVKPDIAVAPFSEACGGGVCIPQPGTHQQLDSLGDRLMYRLAYRQLNGDPNTPGSGTPTMVVNHSVAAGSSVGVRWYELQAASGVFAIAQQGTFAPDSAYRWMGSAAMDVAGNIALGYSESSGSIYPEIAYTGRTPDMTPGQMGSETVLVPGKGSQSTYSRWGDYTALWIDPSDDTTFWYTNEYYTSNRKFLNYLWSTAIGSFKIASGSSYTVSLSASPTAGGTVIGGGSYAAGSQVTVTASAKTGYTFANWTENGQQVSGSASFTFTMPAANVALVANFTAAASGADFTLSPTSASLAVAPHGSNSVSFTVTATGSTSPSVSLSVDDPVKFTSASVSPNPVTATSSGATTTLTVSANRRATGGGTITVTATDASGTIQTATVDLTINP